MLNYNILSSLTGLVSILSQVILIREALNSVSGNELILSVVLGIWLASGGAGAFLARKIRKSKGLIFYSMVLLTLLLPLQILYLRYLHGIISLSGVPSINFILINLLITVIPSSIISGALFSFLSARLSETLNVSKLYVYECAGATIGSLMYLLSLVAGLNSITLSLLITLMTNISLLFLSGEKFKKLISLIISLLSIILLIYNPETKTLEPAYPGQKIIIQKQSPYGTIVVTTAGEQFNLYQNGVLLISGRDPVGREELTHYVMSQIPEAENVLIMGGGYSGIIEEVKKYGTKKIYYIDIDPDLIRITELLFPHSLSSSTILLEDPRKFLKRNNKKFDAILISAPMPLSGALNRFYTYEFFTELKKNLRDNGVMGFGIGGSETYLGGELRKLHSSIYRALRQVFSEILVLPGQKIFYIAGNRPLTENITDKLKELKVNTEYVNEAYLKGRFTGERLNQARIWVMAESKTNRDLLPSAFKYYLDSWWKQFSSSKNIVLPVVILFVLISLYIISNSRSPVLSYASWTNGFYGMSIEIALLLVFQVIYSTIYMDMGVLFSAFMLGMAGGGIITRNFSKRAVLLSTEFLIVLFPLLIFILISSIDLHSIPPLGAKALFFLLLFLSGCLTGAQFYCLFPSISEEPLESASQIYSADLSGSCAGAILTGILIIPLFGIEKSLLLLTLIKATSAFFLSVHLSGREFKIPYRQWHPWAVMFSLLGILGAFIASNNVELYSFSRSKIYTIIVSITLILALLLSGGWIKFVFTNWFRLIQFLLLSLVAFYPIFRCFFKIPYLFCHVCPRQCAFGIYRKYIVITGTITNTGNWPFCHMTCPIGIMYDAQPVSERRVSQSLISKLHSIRLIILILIPFIYFKSKFDESALTPPFLDIYTFMFKNEFTVSITVLCVALFFIAGGFVIPRFFCNLACPLGAVKKLLDKTLNG